MAGLAEAIRTEPGERQGISKALGARVRPEDAGKWSRSTTRDRKVNASWGSEYGLFCGLPSSPGRELSDVQEAVTYFLRDAPMMSGDCPVPLRWSGPRRSADRDVPRLLGRSENESLASAAPAPMPFQRAFGRTSGSLRTGNRRSVAVGAGCASPLGAALHDPDRGGPEGRRLRVWASPEPGAPDARPYGNPVSRGLTQRSVMRLASASGAVCASHARRGIRRSCRNDADWRNAPAAGPARGGLA